MPDGDVVAHGEREAVRVVGARMGDVTDGTVLDAAAAADADAVHVATDDGHGPDGAVIPEHHVPDDGSGGINPYAFPELGMIALVASDPGHGGYLHLNLGWFPEVCHHDRH